jgi:hypothetical protein
LRQIIGKREEFLNTPIGRAFNLYESLTHCWVSPERRAARTELLKLAAGVGEYDDGR